MCFSEETQKVFGCLGSIASSNDNRFCKPMPSLKLATAYSKSNKSQDGLKFVSYHQICLHPALPCQSRSYSSTFHSLHESSSLLPTPHQLLHETISHQAPPSAPPFFTCPLFTPIVNSTNLDFLLVFPHRQGL